MLVMASLSLNLHGQSPFRRNFHVVYRRMTDLGKGSKLQARRSHSHLASGARARLNRFAFILSSVFSSNPHAWHGQVGAGMHGQGRAWAGMQDKFS